MKRLKFFARRAASNGETSVLKLVGDGKTSEEIAAELKLSLKTIQGFRARLMQKLEVQNLQQLTRIAVLWRAGVADIVVQRPFSSDNSIHSVVNPPSRKKAPRRSE